MVEAAVRRRVEETKSSVEPGGKFPREILTRVVELAMPALGTKGPLARELGQFWFTGTHLSAYNGDFGVRVVFDTGLNCGVDGLVFAGLVQSSKAGDVRLNQANDDLIVRFARSRSSLATRPLSRFYWQFPKQYDTSTSLELTEEFLSALKRVLKLRQRGTTDQVEHRGVSLFPIKGGVALYTTDSKTLMEIRVAMDVVPEIAPTVLSRLFAESVAEECEPGDRLYFPSKCLVATTAGVEFFHNRLDVSTMHELPKLVRNKVAEANKLSSFLALPDGLDEALSRAVIVANGADPFVSFAVAADDPTLLRMVGNYSTGDLAEQFKLAGEWPPLTIKLNAAEVLGALSEADSFAFGSSAAVMRGGDDWLFLVAVSS